MASITAEQADTLSSGAAVGPMQICQVLSSCVWFTDVNGLPGILFGDLEFMATGSVRDNKAQSRFELDVEDAVAFANYRLAPGTVVITHTETPRALRGRGIASELVQGALQLIRADGLKVVASCGFVVDYLQKHPEFRDLVG